MRDILWKFLMAAFAWGVMTPVAYTAGPERCLRVGRLVEHQRWVGLKRHFFYRTSDFLAQQTVSRETISSQGLHRRDGENFLWLEARVKNENVFAAAYLTSRGDLLLDLQTRSESGYRHPELRGREFLEEVFRHFEGRIERFAILMTRESALLQELNARLDRGTSIENALERLWGFETLRAHGFSRATAAHLTRRDTFGIDPTMIEAMIVIEPGPVVPRSRRSSWWSRIPSWRR